MTSPSDAPGTPTTPADRTDRATPAQTSPPVRAPRGWLLVFAVLLLALVVSAIVMFTVVRSPSYEPVPIPSVSST